MEAHRKSIRSSATNTSTPCGITGRPAFTVGNPGFPFVQPCPRDTSRAALPPWRQRMADVITCPSGLQGRVRGMKVREERVLADRKLAKSGG